MKRLTVMLVFCLLMFGCVDVFAASGDTAKKRLAIILHSEADTYDLSSTKLGSVTDLVSANISECLIALDSSGNRVPGLATSWKVSLDGKQIEFALRKNVKFHSGDLFTSKDVEFSLKRVIEKRSAYRGHFESMERLELVDDYTVRLHLKQPDAELMFRLTDTWMVSKGYYDKVGEERFVKYPVGTGPYKFVNWAIGQYIDLEANDNYWGGACPIKQVRFDVVKEGTTRAARLQAGEGDIALEIPFPMVKELEKRGFRIVKIPAHPSINMQIHTLNPNVPWYNKKVRLALALAIDGKAIVNNIFQGITDYYAGLAPWEVGYDPNLKPYPYDPALAKKLLAEAGYPQGFEMPLYYMVGRTAGVKESVEAVTLYLAAIGVKCKVMGLEPVSFVEKLRYSWHNNPKAEFVSLSGQTVAQHPDPIIGLRDNFYSTQPFCTYSNPEMDKLLVQARATLDDAERGSLIKKVFEILHEDVIYVPISAHKMIYAMGKNIRYTPTLRTVYPFLLIKNVEILN